MNVFFYGFLVSYNLTIELSHKYYSLIFLKSEGGCIKEWYFDSTMKAYDDMNIYPPPLICPPNKFNLWTPYYADQLPKSTLAGRENEDNVKKVDLVLDLIKVLCN